MERLTSEWGTCLVPAGDSMVRYLGTCIDVKAALETLGFMIHLGILNIFLASRSSRGAIKVILFVFFLISVNILLVLKVRPTFLLFHCIHPNATWICSRISVFKYSKYSYILIFLLDLVQALFYSKEEKWFIKGCGFLPFLLEWA